MVLAGETIMETSGMMEAQVEVVRSIGRDLSTVASRRRTMVEEQGPLLKAQKTLEDRKKADSPILVPTSSKKHRVGSSDM